MRKKLTASVIAKLSVPEGKSYIKLFDTEVSGLGVRITASGVASFIFEKRPKGLGKMKQKTIGRCSDMSVDHARQIARNLVLEFSSDTYILTEMRKSAIPTFKDAVQIYESLHLSKKSPNYREKTLGTISRYLMKPLGDLKVSDVSRTEIVSIITPIMHAEKHSTAKMIWEAASNVLTWAVRFGHRELNPLLHSKPNFQERSRERYLSLDEVKSIWNACDSLKEPHKAAVRLLIVLPLRKTEFLHSVWGEIDEDWITIPSRRTKNNDQLSLFLSNFAQEQLPIRRNDTDLMFSTDGNVPTRLGSKIQNKLREVSGVHDWQFHDFRRTFSTHMYEANIQGLLGHSYIIDACLNHRDSTRRGVAGIYNRAEYKDLKKIALQAWSDIIAGAVNDG
jgi:integrase